jgi:hypothetical protein
MHLLGASPPRHVFAAEGYAGGMVGNPGHGRPWTAWAASGTFVGGFLVGGVGLTVGPRVLIWIGVAIAVVTGAVGLLTHVWSDTNT